jgi:uracil-DNA glycosylase
MFNYFNKWLKVIDKKELHKIIKFIDQQSKSKIIHPSKNNIFKAFKLCPYDKLKVVFLGQDPYPQRGVATGILFGNNTEDNISSSLDIIKEAVIDYSKQHSIIKFDNSLESWCTQGVLMLNSALTVIENEIGSHTMLWRPFISKLLYNLSNIETGIIYVLFGNIAQSFTPYINKEYNIILCEKHPSYYARSKQSMSSNLFKIIDKELINRYGSSIKWYEEYD